MLYDSLFAVSLQFHRMLQGSERETIPEDGIDSVNHKKVMEPKETSGMVPETIYPCLELFSNTILCKYFTPSWRDETQKMEEMFP